MDDKLTQFSNCQAAMTFVVGTRSQPFTGHNKQNAIWKVLCTLQKMQVLKAQALISDYVGVKSLTFLLIHFKSKDPA